MSPALTDGFFTLEPLGKPCWKGRDQQKPSMGKSPGNRAEAPVMVLLYPSPHAPALGSPSPPLPLALCPSLGIPKSPSPHLCCSNLLRGGQRNKAVEPQTQAKTSTAEALNVSCFCLSFGCLIFYPLPSAMIISSQPCSQPPKVSLFFFHLTNKHL